LAGADLSHFDLSFTNLTKASLREARLDWANLEGADLIGADLGRADLRGANLKDANLRDAALHRSMLFYATFDGTDVTDTDFTGAQVMNSYFLGVDLRQARGLQSMRHAGPSSVDIDTLTLSEGQIPVHFLQGAGVPEPFITFMKSLTGAAFDFYSSFISYSTKDQEFADRLYADLQAKGLRCYLASEDLKIGERFRSRIDESIRTHDKLLLVLSEHSIRSPWVEKEVETALEREHREKRTVLFPIRLDDTVMETNEAWAADIRRTRHIGDFTGWDQHAKHVKAFERLMRDLKASV